MKPRSRKQGELFWPKIILRKWLNLPTKDSDFNADDDRDSASEFENEERCSSDSDSSDEEKRTESSRKNIPYRRRRRNSETLRAQYINAKDIRICVGTWNVGGRLPPDDLDIREWLEMEDPADIYVIGLQEIVPLNAGNIFGAEDSRPVPRWENIIRETLNKIEPSKKKYKCYSDPPSPSRFKPSDDIPDIKDEILAETDEDNDDEVHPLPEEEFRFNVEKDGFAGSGDEFKSKFTENAFQELDLWKQSLSRRLDRLHCLRLTDQGEYNETSVDQQNFKLTRVLSTSERLGLSWPEKPLDLLAQHTLDQPNSFKSVKSFRACNSFKPLHLLEDALLTEINLDSLMHKKRKSAFVRIVSKQMVGIFLTVWVRRNLRKHIQNLKVSTVGVGLMGYIGNKGSISVSMSIYQTDCCFICSHLTSGEKDGDELRRNADVQEIHHRTLFSSVTGVGFPKSIYDHERIIWLGDLNYRINLSYDKTRELISNKEWSALAEKDQLTRELRKGHAFGGWSEGTLNFPPTYKYEFNSEKYVGEDPKSGRRTPAWCDRILTFGKGMRLLKYKRVEHHKLSDHRPVTAIITAEVEVFCHRKLQRALTFTDAEIEEGEILPDDNLDVSLSGLRFGEEILSGIDEIARR
ncbi:Type I inositol 1,4,5-trisphosphate 5-phosphatase 1 [Acorus gramineus]|uniref:Type I inositol 1,4,5-trisphosphate 5-phosphatase 1 n=1 Tax=Acorus gramineus TaxID=55184 RepID=A0AAV9AKP0_ACOGR|nr:Type I inositol 1,4,5-trisphosphate 5-phosphatase 1 [Acorus gramineus]